VRKLGMLTALEKTNIVHAKVVDGQPADEIARQYRVKQAAVFYLVKKAVKNESYLSSLMEKELV
jgi:hypothetical protein